METMISARDLQRLRNSCGYDSGLCVSSVGLSGGLGFWWYDVDVQLLTYDRHHVAVDVLGENGVPLWRAIGVYGWPETSNKHLTWNMIRNLCHNCHIPIVLFGDFNEILSEMEKEGGAVRQERQMDAFREALDDCALLDLGYNGSIYTWQRGRVVGNVIRERLDRAVATETWCATFPNMEVHHLPRYRSDHSPIIIKEDFFQRGTRRKRNFKFEAFWLSDPECANVVKRASEEMSGRDINDKVTNCLIKMSSWTHKTFGDLKTEDKRKRR